MKQVIYFLIRNLQITSRMLYNRMLNGHSEQNLKHNIIMPKKQPSPENGNVGDSEYVEQVQITLSDKLYQFPSLDKPIDVSLSTQLIDLLSEQLYQSPLKAIEELVVNAYDADASECRVFTPSGNEQAIIAIYDNGTGMSEEGLRDLWHIGHSNKRQENQHPNRKQIGKFGIGKLATYTLANELTYVTKYKGQILAVSVDFKKFTDAPTGGQTISVPVQRFDDLRLFENNEVLLATLTSLGISINVLTVTESWTLAILGALKPKLADLKSGQLVWILRTAMPLGADFAIYYNRQQLQSSKEERDKVVEFVLSEMPPTRLANISTKQSGSWQIDGNKLVCQLFPSGVSGSVFITKTTLTGGKSDDLERSHGFFIKVRGRLVNTTDALFVSKALEHGTFNRMHAEISADDLDEVIKASRETLDNSRKKEVFGLLLREIFNEANSRYSEYEKRSENKQFAREGNLETVPKRLVERPLADVLSDQELLIQTQSVRETSINEGWFYLKPLSRDESKAVIEQLFADGRRKYQYRYTQGSEVERLVQFDIVQSTFWINENHELALEFKTEDRAASLLKDVAAMEALLEIYLRQTSLTSEVINQILARRDELFRLLVKDHLYAASTIAKHLRDAKDDAVKLEVALVIAVRSLGFAATHISAAGQPDGLATFADYPDGVKRITLEAKSSRHIPDLGQIDFSGLQSHKMAYNADGCLLISPIYPGQNEPNSQVQIRAQESSISCWTVDQLADFIERATDKHLSARDILDIVCKSFSPLEVAAALSALYDSRLDNTELYNAILNALERVHGAVTDAYQTVDVVVTQVALTNTNFNKKQDIEPAMRTLANASKGGMFIDDAGKIRINVSFEVLKQRLASLTSLPSKPNSVSEFRE